jgi:signal transduction histidine kinase
MLKEKASEIIWEMVTETPAKEIKPTILVVEDEPAIRLGLAATIRRQGYEVVMAESGLDGLSKARETRPDLILSDVMMPQLNGFEMRRELSCDPALASIPFIFLTARSATEDRITGIREGADDYITKPFVAEELLARIDAVFRRVKTERDIAREQTKAAARDEMEKMQREILQNFRHELRTPLGNVMMSLDMILEQKFDKPEEQAEFMQLARSSVDRLESVVTDIIFLSDMDHDDLNSLRQTIDITHHILYPVQRRLKRYEASELNFTHTIHLGGTIYAPRREFSHALMHLVDNAFKFSPPRGAVELTIKSGRNGGAEVIVRDEGPGIPPELREKVFERFYQASQGDAREHQGLGVGLTIARAVFRKLGGDVLIADTAPGCCVMATLPDLVPGDRTYG